MAGLFKKLKSSERGDRLSDRFSSLKPSMSMDQSQSASSSSHLPSTGSDSNAGFPSPNPSRPQSTTLPVVAQFDSSHLTIGAGVAIFHVATGRVVLCYHPHHRYHFLPKGRRDANEETIFGAEREGYEESGYRSRILPLPIVTRQPQPNQNARRATTDPPFVTEPVWTQLLPVSGTSQYILHWYIAETLPPTLDAALAKRTVEQNGAYQYPMRFQDGMTLRERVQLDVELESPATPGQAERYYEPVRHEGREIVQEEEKAYESSLVPWEDALRLLGESSVSADVVRRGWRAIEMRLDMEEKVDLGRMGI